MSSDEVIVTVVAILVGPVLWMAWLFRMSQMRARARRGGVMAMGLTLVVCAGFLLYVLQTAASFDVIDAPKYLFMYVVLGLAWLRVAAAMFPFLGLSPRDEVFERGNRASATAVVGALGAVTLCYAGGNIGDGPGWWVVLFAAALATGTLLVTWAALTRLTAVIDAVTIDRDPAAGLRLGAFLYACGLVLGRGVAGDWMSAAATVADFAEALPGVLVMLVLAIIVERASRPSQQRPRAPFIALGVLPAGLYIAVAITAVWMMQWPI